MGPVADEIWQVGDVVVVTMRGPLTGQLVEKCRHRAVQALKKWDSSAVLYDARQVAAPSVAHLGPLAEDAGDEPAVRGAIVVPDSRIAYRARLAFGPDMRVFYASLSEALDWLLGAQDHRDAERAVQAG